MTNDFIADQFSLLSKIMDIHGENSFKTKSYSSAAFAIEKLPTPLSEIDPAKITSIKGIGDAIGKKITQIIHTGELPLLREYIEKTPPGILEMLRIKGLGPKKIATIWKEMEIETLGELLYACQENRLLLFKGFGEKTQQSVHAAIEFYFSNQGSHLFAEIESYATSIHNLLQSQFPQSQLSFTGQFRRQLEIIDQLEWITTAEPASTAAFMTSNGFTQEISPASSAQVPTSSSAPESSPAPESSAASPAPTSAAHPKTIFRGPENIPLIITHTSPASFASTLFSTSCSGEFLSAWHQHTGQQTPASPVENHPVENHPVEDHPVEDYSDEQSIFDRHNIHFIPPFLREQRYIIDRAAEAPIPALIQTQDIRAIIHSHSKWSDGSNTLEEMARACIDAGYEYLVISDHSKTAFYANGLSEERVAAQHREIDELNKKLAPFVIFKSIESDILNDGALDYSDSILSTFDLVIASVHSNLRMPADKAMSRLLRAIENPHTTILGHMTGRLLLSRPGYPVDHKKIIEACAANNVAIELNAHPRRLDMDWRWISYALDKGVLISIDPDAHSTAGYHDVKYGVLAAQKAGLTPDKNLSSFSLTQFRQYLDFTGS